MCSCVLFLTILQLTKDLDESDDLNESSEKKYCEILKEFQFGKFHYILWLKHFLMFLIVFTFIHSQIRIRSLQKMIMEHSKLTYLTTTSHR